MCILYAYRTVVTYLFLEQEDGAHGLDFGGLWPQLAVLSEQPKGQRTALFWRCVLLPAIWDLALQLLDKIVIDEVMGFCSGPVLLH